MTHAQLTLSFPRTTLGLAAVDAILASLDGGPPVTLAPEVYDELKAAGDIEAWEELELELTGEAVDWADPDGHDLETMRWYDEASDPYARGPAPVEACEFMLGTHRPHWLYAAGSRDAKPAGPLFVSMRQIRHARRTAWPVCDTPYAIDSGGFTEIRQHGRWVTPPEVYAREVVELDERTGTLRWAAVQDWMVEDDALERTGLTVAEHQRRTIESYLKLRELAPSVRWLPVLQGQTLADYLDHIEQYRAAGVHLATVGRVGVGSVCRRQASAEICEILRELAARGLRLHGFGVKTGGLELAAGFLASSDSLAWSLGAARRGAPGDANRMSIAEDYRAKMLSIPGVM